MADRHFMFDSSMSRSEEAVHALDDVALQRVAGAAAWERGRRYAASGAVVPLSERSPLEGTFAARVAGTRTYDTEVRIDGDTLEGRCDCPQGDGDWFCKHQVAVAIVWRQRLKGERPEIGAETAESARTPVSRLRAASDKREALRHFLGTQDVPTLARKLLEIADGDREVMRGLLQWQKIADAADRQDLKPLISELLLSRHDLLRRSDCRLYVERAQAVLPLLEQRLERDPAMAAAAGLHALRRVWSALRHADDGDGVIGALCARIGELWVRALKASGPQPAKFGDAYLQVRLDDPVESFDAAEAERAIGEQASTRYRRVLATRWRSTKDAVLALKAQRAVDAQRRGLARGGFVPTSRIEIELWTLERLHLAQLAAQGLVDETIAVLAEDLSTAHAYAVLVAYLEEHGRTREAFSRAEAGQKAFPDARETQEAMVRAYERDGWFAEAFALRRRQFAEAPDVAGFHAVMAAGRLVGHDEAPLREELFGLAAEREERGLSWRRGRSFGIASRSDAERIDDRSFRAEVLCSENRRKEASTLVASPATCREEVLLRIARNLPATEDDEAFSLISRVLDDVMRTATSPYSHALSLVREALERTDAARRQAWLETLRTRFKAKRRFIEGLPLR